MPKIIEGVTLYTSKETAEKLGINIVSLCALRSKGLLAYTQLGHSRMTSAKQLEDFLNGVNKETMEKKALAEALLSNLK